MFVPYHVLPVYIVANGWFQFCDVAAGLQSLHRLDVIHGDIHPVCQRLAVLFF